MTCPATGETIGHVSSYSWPGEDGWPYPDPSSSTDQPTLDGLLDDDALLLHAASPNLLDDLDPLERRVIRSRFGIDGSPVVSMKQLQGELGLPRAELRLALGSGLDKLRRRLT